jgi:hypothetical protein
VSQNDFKNTNAVTIFANANIASPAFFNPSNFSLFYSLSNYIKNLAGFKILQLR